VRAKVIDYDNGTKVRFQCQTCGHKWTHDFSKGRKTKRIGPTGVAMLVKYWRASGVTDPCSRCGSR
jgi:transposase-like protein